MKFKPITGLGDEISSNIQMVSSELDTSPIRLRYISDKEGLDAIELDSFNKVWNEIKDNNAIITSIDDNTDLYEIEENSVVLALHEELNIRYILFDIQDIGNVKKMLNKYM